MNVPQLLRDRLGIDLQEIAGARASGELPLAEEAVNRLLAERLRDHPQVSSVRVQAQDGDAVAVQIVPRMRMMPPLRVLARVERQPQLPHEPTLVLRWSMPAAGPLALFAAPVLSFFNAMPAGISMDGDRIAVDLRTLLRARGLEEALAFARELAIHTRPGAFVVRFALGVQESEGAGP